MGKRQQKQQQQCKRRRSEIKFAKPANRKKKKKIRTDFKRIIIKSKTGGDENDTNYIFLRFVVDYLPKGLVGLLIAVIFLAAWGSIAAALNSLASCTVIDIHKKFIKKDCTELADYKMSRWYTI